MIFGWLKNNFKLFCLFLLFFFLSAATVSRLFFLQILKGEYYQALAMGQQFSLNTEQGERGRIYDKNGELLAKAQKEYVIYLLPEKIIEAEKDELAQLVAPFFDRNKEEMLVLFEENKPLKKEVSKEEFKNLSANEFKGLCFEITQTRVYPFDNLAADILGFVNDEGDGQYGLEGYYDKVLKGEEKIAQKGRSPFGYLASFFEPEAANDYNEPVELWLTIDKDIQYFAQKLLKIAKEKWQIEAGQIIVSEPSTGRILALADFPDFNPSYFSQEKDIGIFTNSALQKIFEPGSIIKAITMAGGLEEELITPQTEYEDKGFLEIGWDPIYNFQKKVWGRQTMTNVLENSINTGAVFVEQKLGKKKFLEYLEAFGFFEETKIDLQGEVFSTNQRLQRGYERDLAAASFGQGLEATALQVVRAFSVIANGGQLVRPYLVEKIIDAEGREMLVEPEIEDEIISQNTASRLTAMLISAVENGFAKEAMVEGYAVAGKTSTAQIASQKGGYQEDAAIQSFIGYFPAYEPQFLIFVKLDNPRGVGSAGWSAAPLFHDLAKYIIDTEQIPPEFSPEPPLDPVDEI